MIEISEEAKSGEWRESASIVLLAVGGEVWSEHYLAEIGSGGPWHAAGPHRCFRRLLPPEDQHNLSRSTGAGTLGRARRRRSKEGRKLSSPGSRSGHLGFGSLPRLSSRGNSHTQPHARSAAAADGGGVFGGGLWLPAFVADSRNGFDLWFDFPIFLRRISHRFLRWWALSISR
jgi:hypothetical protein